MTELRRPRPDDELFRALFRDPQNSQAPTSNDPRKDPLFDALMGRSPRAVRAPETPEPAPTPERPSILGEVGVGFTEGLSRERTDITGAAGVVAKLFGEDEAAERLLELARSRTVEASQTAAPRVSFDEAFTGVEPFVRWLARATGESIPVMATVILGGGVGGLAAKLTARGVGRAATARAVEIAGRLGQAAGGTLTGAASFGVGSVANEQFARTGRIDPTSAIIAGTAMGAFEAVTPLISARAVGILGDGADDFVAAVGRRVAEMSSRPSRAAVAAGRIGVIEGVTELLQEATQLEAQKYVDEHAETLGPEGRKRLLEAAVTGFFVGGVIGGGVGALAGRATPQTPLEDVTVSPAERPQTQAPLALPAPPQEESFFGLSSGEAQIALITQPDNDSFFGVDPLDVQIEEEPGLVEQPTPENENFELELDDTLRSRAITNPLRNGRFFRTGVDTFLNEDFEGGDQQLALTRDALDRADISAGLTVLPDTLRIDDPNVEFLNPDTRDKALDLANRAIKLMKERAENEFTDPEALDRAEKLYERALDLGFRYRTDGQGSFVLASEEGITEADFVPLRFNPSQILSASRNRGDFWTIPESSIKNKFPRIQVPGSFPGRAYEIDPEGALNAGELLFKANTPMFQEGRAPTLHDIRTLSPENFKIARKVSGKVPHYARRVPNLAPFRQTLDIQAGELNHLPDWLKKHGRTINGKDIEQLVKDDKLADEVLSKSVSIVRPDIRSLSEEEFKIVNKTLNKIAKLLRSLHSKLNLTESIILGTDNTVGSLGSYLPFKLDLNAENVAHGITLDVLNILRNHKDNFSALVTTTVHELGHALEVMELARLPQAEMEEIHSAYKRDLVRSLYVRGERGLARMVSPAWFKDFQITAPIIDEVAVEEFLKGRNARVDYYLSFDEWFAEKSVTWFMRENLDETSAIGKVFRRVGKLWHDLFEMVHNLVKREDTQFDPGVAFDSFMTYLQRRKSTRVNAEPAALVLSGELNRNARISSTFSDTIPLVKHQASTARTSNLINKLKIPEKEVDMRGMRDLNDYYNWVVDVGWNVLQLADKNPHIALLQRYVTEVQRWYTKKMSWMSRANDRTKEWMAIGKEASDALTKFIFDIDQMVYLKAEEEPRQPTDEEMITIGRKHGLTQEGFDLYRKIRQDFLDFLTELEIVVKKDSARVLGRDSPAYIFEEARIEKEFEALRRRPYFPHSRFGQFAVVVKGEGDKTVWMEQFASHKEARRNFARVRKEAQKENPGVELVAWVDKIPESVSVFRGLPATLLDSIRGNLKLSVEQNAWLDHLIVDMAPSKSFRKRLGKRDNVPGFTRDALRSYSDYFWHAANHMARIDHGEELRRIVQDMGTEAGELGRQGFDVAKRRRIVDFLGRHMEQILNPKPDWAQLRSFAFQWWLGFVPASAVLNLTQVPIVTYPYLAARFNDAKAVAAISRAYTQIHKMYASPTKAQERMNEADFKLLDLAVQGGFIDESMAMELAALSEGSNLTRLRQGTAAQRTMMNFAHLSGLMFQAAEKVNRRVAFRAGVDLARRNPDSKYIAELRQQKREEYIDLIAQQGLSPSEASAFLVGKDTVLRTQYEYSAYARPQFMQGKKGVIFTFYMFLQNSLWFARYSPGNARYLAMMVAAAGLMGLPGGEDLMALSKAIARQFDVHFDPERELRTFIVDNFGSNFAADLALHGTGQFGFGLPAAADAIGIPIPEFDMSAAVGLGQIIPGAAAMGPAGLDFEQRFSQATEDIAGASLGIGINLLRFLSDSQLPIDDSKRYERVMPRALRNVFKSIRFGTEGQERSRNRAEILDFNIQDPAHLMELGMVATGFQPSRLTRRWDRIIAQRDAEAFWAARRTMVMAQYDHAVLVRDKEARADATAAIRRFNKELPQELRSIAITRKTLKASLKSRNNARQRIEQDRGRTRMFDPLARETQRLYPLDVDVPQQEKAPVIGR